MRNYDIFGAVLNFGHQVTAARPMWRFVEFVNPPHRRAHPVYPLVSALAFWRSVAGKFWKERHPFAVYNLNGAVAMMVRARHRFSPFISTFACPSPFKVCSVWRTEVRFLSQRLSRGMLLAGSLQASIFQKVTDWIIEPSLRLSFHTLSAPKHR